jgi:hypothetical protein
MCPKGAPDAELLTRAILAATAVPFRFAATSLLIIRKEGPGGTTL